MPNHVMNVLRMSGIAGEPLFHRIDGGELQFDFNKLIKMPDELALESGSMTTDAMAALVAKLLPYLSWIGVSEVRDNLAKHLKSRGGGDAELGLKYASNLVKYGHATWYEWCWEKWGTKWNAYSTLVVDENEIRFETAWNDPAPVIAELAVRYPTRCIEHWWADEDVGYNTGYRMWENGTMTELEYDGGSQEALENYGYCWGEDIEDGDTLYRDEDGLIKFREF